MARPPIAAQGGLTGRKAIITGGDSGIGRAVAIAFAREGADILISCLPEEEEGTILSFDQLTADL
jgi:NAD(P)-dependent dehydrogenase (short-subunit alcohol dehydrogenase family)